MKVVKMYDEGEHCPYCKERILESTRITYHNTFVVECSAKLIFCPNQYCKFENLVTGNEIEVETYETY